MKTFEEYNEFEESSWGYEISKQTWQACESQYQKRIEELEKDFQFWYDKCAEVVDQKDKLRDKLKEAEEVIAFYADIENWQLRTFNETGVQKGWAMRVRDGDVEYIQGPNRYFGGKRARDYQKKYGEKEITK